MYVCMYTLVFHYSQLITDYIQVFMNTCVIYNIFV